MNICSGHGCDCGSGTGQCDGHSLALKRAAFLNQNREQFPVAGADEVNRMIGISHEGALAIEAEPYYLYRQKILRAILRM